MPAPPDGRTRVGSSYIALIPQLTGFIQSGMKQVRAALALTCGPRGTSAAASCTIGTA